MRKHIIISTLIYLSISSSLVARWIDTGFIKWEQPNGEEFVARHWGDEWISWMETEDGYRIIESPNGWFHYAKLDRIGEFTPSQAMVSIDNPPSKSKGLKRTQARIRKIETERQAFYLSLQQQNSLTELSGSFPRTLKLGVVLLDFTPSRITTIYEKSVFDNMIFSEGYWYGEPTAHNNYQTVHPEDEAVYGSLRDYYLDQTVDNIDIVGKNNLPQIINPPDPNNSSLPDWLVLPNSMQYYEDNFGSTALFQHLYEQAESEYGEAEMASYEVVAFIYGGSVRTSGNFSPKFRWNMYIMGEHEYGSFVHIGTHAHEFAHAAFNASDEYLEDINPWYWSLMAYGNYNGPLSHGSCPAPLGAPYRVKF